MELYQMPEKRKRMLALNEGKLRTWQPLPTEDRRVLRHGKIFIGRNGMINADRVEVIAYYTNVELVSLLRQNGFYDTKIYEGFDDMPHFEGKSPTLVVLANRHHGEPTPLTA